MEVLRMTNSPASKKKINRFISLGARTVDAILKVEKIPTGDAKVMAEDGVVIGAGMTVAAACTASMLGGNVFVWGRIGSDKLGDFFLSDISDAGVDTTSIHRVQGAKTGLSSVIVDGGGRRLIVPYYDPNLDSDPSWLPIELLDETDCVLADVRWPEGALKILNEAKKRGLLRIFDGDVATHDILNLLAPLATHAIFSEPGFCLFAGEGDLKETLLNHAAKFDGCMGVTLGEDGAIRQVHPPQIVAIDTLAAGDVFHGAFAIAITEGMTVENAAKYACAAAAIKCSRFGGRIGIPTRHEVETLVEATYGKIN
jgi:sulfofructose kinase